jgi:hypothetical protein
MRFIDSPVKPYEGFAGLNLSPSKVLHINTKGQQKSFPCKENFTGFVFSTGELMSVSNAQKVITETLLLWEGVSTEPHRFGGVEYRLGTREFGHIHGDHLLDIPFPKKVRDEIVKVALAEPHHILPETGWVSFYLRKEEDVQKAIGLLRRSYEIALKQKQRR